MFYAVASNSSPYDAINVEVIYAVRALRDIALQMMRTRHDCTPGFSYLIVYERPLLCKKMSWFNEI